VGGEAPGLGDQGAGFSDGGYVFTVGGLGDQYVALLHPLQGLPDGVADPGPAGYSPGADAGSSGDNVTHGVHLDQVGGTVNPHRQPGGNHHQVAGADQSGPKG